MFARRLVLALALVVAVCAPVVAQEEAAVGLDHVFNGFSGVLWQADLSSLNEALERAGYPPLSHPVLAYGETVTIGLSTGPRLGFAALTGSTSSGAPERKAKMAFALLGGILEWGLPTTSGDGIAVSLMLGAGTSTLTLVDHAPSSFEEALVVPFRAKLDRWLYAVEPSIAAYETLIPGLTVRAQVGYLITIGCDWKVGEIAYEYPMGGFSGLSAKLSISVDFGPMSAALLEGSTASEAD
jgi:hypothetical protein